MGNIQHCPDRFQLLTNFDSGSARLLTPNPRYSAFTYEWFLPHERVADLLKRKVPDEADSWKLLDGPPGPNDVGYEAYLDAMKRRGGNP